MTYDLTAVLTTIAAASASIVAILGGFIASKLISIDGERNSVIFRLREIDEEVKYRIKTRDIAQRENDEDDALHFICNYLEELKNSTSLTDVIKRTSEPDLPIETLHLYWQRAITASSAFQTKIEHLNGEKLNGDCVPESLYCLYHGSNFEYQVCKLLGDDLYTRYKKSNDLFHVTDNPKYPSSFENMHRYRWNQQKIAEENAALGLLELQVRNYKIQATSLKKPKGMKIGLTIFAIFSIGCIIAPLALSPFTTDNLRCYNLIKWGVLGLFFFVFFSIFLYLVYLLLWIQK